MTLITMLRPEQQKLLRRLRKRIANREHMRRARERRKLCCVGVDLPIEAGTCGRMVHAEAQRCVHCAKRRWWLLNHAMNQAEVVITGPSRTARRRTRTICSTTFRTPSRSSTTTSPTSAPINREWAEPRKRAWPTADQWRNSLELLWEQIELGRARCGR